MIKENYERVLQGIKSRAQLIVVSKTRTIDEIQEVIHLGHKEFGENKVQELGIKSEHFKDMNINWHFIGHLQSNKINQLLKCANLASIHSIDRLSLLEKILEKKTENSIGLFLQVNTSHEEEKSGFHLENENEINQAVKLIEQSRCFYLQGLMTIGKIRTDKFEKDANDCFEALLSLKAKLDKAHDLDLQLSMGMSQDYEIALKYQSSWVRIGTEIFGARA